MKKSSLSKRSPVLISKAKRDTLAMVKKYVRESGPCVASGQGRKSCGGYMQASHIKSEGAYKHLFIDPRNIYPMCMAHHLYWWHKEPTEAGNWFKEKYPINWKYLEWAKQQHIQYTVNELIGLQSALRQGWGEYCDAFMQLMASKGIEY